MEDKKEGWEGKEEWKKKGKKDSNRKREKYPKDLRKLRPVVEEQCMITYL